MFPCEIHPGIEPMVLYARFSSFACIALGVVSLAFSATLSAAQERRQPAAKTGADKACAEFGPNFVSGDSPGHCVQIEQRLRVGRNARRNMSAWESANTFAPILDGGPMPAHLRLNGRFGIAHSRE